MLSGHGIYPTTIRSSDKTIWYRTSSPGLPSGWSRQAGYRWVLAFILTFLAKLHSTTKLICMDLYLKTVKQESVTMILFQNVWFVYSYWGFIWMLLQCLVVTLDQPLRQECCLISFNLHVQFLTMYYFCCYSWKQYNCWLWSVPVRRREFYPG